MKNILEKFKKALQTNKPLSRRQNKKDSTFQYVNIQISSNKLSQSLQKAGITYRKTYDVHWPFIDEKFIPAYLRGYFDGDGSISHNFELNTLYKVNINIAGFQNNLKNIQKYLLTQGIKTTIVLDRREGKYTTEQPFGSLTFTNKKTKMISFI